MTVPPPLGARASVGAALRLWRTQPLVFGLAGVLMQLPGLAWDWAFPLKWEDLQAGNVTELLGHVGLIPYLSLGSLASLWLTWTFVTAAGQAAAQAGGSWPRCCIPPPALCCRWPASWS